MHPDQISVSFSVEILIIMSIGEKMNDIHEEAYMNGYNWETFLNFYLAINDPDVAINIESDPEVGMYAAYYELNSENIRHTVQNEWIHNRTDSPHFKKLDSNWNFY